MENTKIQWATHTFNPWIGCSKVHAGCLNCYAEELMAGRYKKVVWGPNGTRRLASASKWREPVRWDKAAQCNCGAAGAGGRQCEWCNNGCQRPRVFCASLADVFEDWQGPIVNAKGETLCAGGEAELPMEMDDVRRRLFALIDATPNLDWLLLTKRPENIRRMWPQRYMERDASQGPYVHFNGGMPRMIDQSRSNVWLLTSPTDQKTHDAAWPHLAKCRDLVPVLGLSAEPLTGPIDLGGARPGWVITGGESGRDARPCAFEWLLDLQEQCRKAEIPCFIKQAGSRPVTTNANLLDWLDDEPEEFAWGTGAASCGYKLKDPKGGDIDEWPLGLRSRQFPEVAL